MKQRNLQILTLKNSLDIERCNIIHAKVLKSASNKPVASHLHPNKSKQNGNVRMYVTRGYRVDRKAICGLRMTEARETARKKINALRNNEQQCSISYAVRKFTLFYLRLYHCTLHSI